MARTLSFLDGRKKITVGESATKIIEGEPLSHPEFGEIIRLVRQKFPRTLISVTTNGHRLDYRMAGFLKEMAPLEINLSLNSASMEGRAALMGDDRCTAEQTIHGVKLLHSYQIPFHGSIVAMPHLVGWEDMAGTIRYLAENGALTIRAFMAGYSQKASPELRFDPSGMYRQLASFRAEMAGKISCPLLLEPPGISDLTPVVAGVIKGSKAAGAGIRRGDLVCKANDLVPRSRVEAWHCLQQPGPIHALINRQGSLMPVHWQNERGEKSGVVMEYDFDMDRMEAMYRIIGSGSGTVLLLSSELGIDIVRAVLQFMNFPDRQIRIQPVKNRLFGGSIGAAGLLTVEDLFAAYQEYHAGQGRPHLIMVPREAFDYQGYDLMGRPFWELEERTGIQVTVG
ncbi:DUF512 domain-containing protein [Candidatus Formimonas warabiya]|uniref:DUF512 domain-containing protein n=1 Tax=Formimonas warabiya TaxID=1761012 RepID=UPI001BE40B62|nr:DUF512 domain-containing protein [Candidatus Formimonas warabiya]